MNRTRLSIVIPAYNESERLDTCLCTLTDYFAKKGFSLELIVVDDGSSDGTAEIARARQAQLEEVRLAVLQNPQNRGKGESVRRGMLEASGRLTLLTDADLSTPAEEFDKMHAALQQHEAQIAIGSRDLPGSDVLVRQSNFRERSGKVFNVLVRLLLRLPFRDTQCGFKLFRTEPCRTLFQKQSVGRFSFDVEILLMAKIKGLRIIEVPVVWRHDRGSRVRFFRDGSRMIFDLLRIAGKYWSGSYHRALKE